MDCVQYYVWNRELSGIWKAQQSVLRIPAEGEFLAGQGREGDVFWEATLKNGLLQFRG